MLKQLKLNIATKLTVISFMLTLCAISSDGEMAHKKILIENNSLTEERRLRWSSCRNDCNFTRTLRSQCYCESQCFVFRNCCDDITTECPDVAREGITTFGHLLDLQVECLPLAGVLAVASCPNQTTYTNKLINEDSFFDIINSVPVTDVDTGIVYANMDVFKCNSLNASKSGIRWTITVLHESLFPPDSLTSNSRHQIFRNPFYYPNVKMMYPYACNPSSVSACNNSIALQRTCRSFIPPSLLRNLIYNATLCEACKLNVSTISLHVSIAPNLYGRAFVVPEKGLLQINNQLWKEATCDMSKNATLSAHNCQFVKCDSSCYLHEDGTCRMFSLLSIGFQNDLWLLNQAEYDSLLNYMMYYLSRYLDVIPLGAVKPLCSLYSTQLQQNFSIATFVLDFNSSSSEDYVYIKYKDELSILASEIRAMIEYKITQINKSNTGLKLINDVIGQQWVENETNKTKLGQAVFNWCSCPKLNFSLFTSSENKSLMCLSRLTSYRQALHKGCYQLEDDPFRCFDEVSQNIYGSKQSSSLAKLSYGNLMFLFAHFFVVGFLKPNLLN